MASRTELCYIVGQDSNAELSRSLQPLYLSLRLRHLWLQMWRHMSRGNSLPAASTPEFALVPRVVIDVVSNVTWKVATQKISSTELLRLSLRLCPLWQHTLHGKL